MRLEASCMRVYPHKLMGVWGGGGGSTSLEKSRAVHRKAKSAMLLGALSNLKECIDLSQRSRQTYTMHCMCKSYMFFNNSYEAQGYSPTPTAASSHHFALDMRPLSLMILYEASLRYRIWAMRILVNTLVMKFVFKTHGPNQEFQHVSFILERQGYSPTPTLSHPTHHSTIFRELMRAAPHGQCILP